MIPALPSAVTPIFLPFKSLNVYWAILYHGHPPDAPVIQVVHIFDIERLGLLHSDDRLGGRCRAEVAGPRRNADCGGIRAARGDKGHVETFVLEVTHVFGDEKRRKGFGYHRRRHQKRDLSRLLRLRKA